MEMVKLSENVTISRLVQGFWRLTSWNYSTEALVRFMNICVDMGLTTFDTAEIYGATLCETLMGNAFRKDPALLKKIQIVTKTGIFQKGANDKTFGYYDTTYARIIQSCKESLLRLGVEKIDVYLIHREDPCFDPWETGRALETLQKDGLVLEIGVSNFDPYKFNALNTAVNNKLITNQIEWNPICFEHFNSGMIDYLAMKKLHPMVWSPLAGGEIFSQKNIFGLKAMEKIIEIARRYSTSPESIIYAWILYHPVGAIPIIGSKHVHRISNAIEAFKIKLDRSEWYEIYTASGQQILR